MDYQKIQDSQIAAEKLQAQKNVAALYAEVKHYFESAKTEDIVSSLEHIKKSIEEDSKYSLTTDEYTLLGFITYLIGLDVTNSREHVKVVPADNLRSRFIDNSLISRLAYDGSGAVTRDWENHSLCTFQTGKRYNCDLSASYNIGARYFIRELLKSLPATERSLLEAKVPPVKRRTSCVYADLRKLHSEMERLKAA